MLSALCAAPMMSRLDAVCLKALLRLAWTLGWPGAGICVTAHGCMIQKAGIIGVLKLVKKNKSAAPIKYVVNYEYGSSPYHGALQVIDGNQLRPETQHGSQVANLNPRSGIRSLTMVLLLEMGAKLVSISPHSR
jgi:hypothetical protein